MLPSTLCTGFPRPHHCTNFTVLNCCLGALYGSSTAGECWLLPTLCLRLKRIEHTDSEPRTLDNSSSSVSSRVTSDTASVISTRDGRKTGEGPESSCSPVLARPSSQLPAPPDSGLRTPDSGSEIAPQLRGVSFRSGGVFSSEFNCAAFHLEHTCNLQQGRASILYLAAVATMSSSAIRSPFRDDCLRGKVVLVTGGGSGIGFQITRQIGQCQVTQRFRSVAPHACKPESRSSTCVVYHVRSRAACSSVTRTMFYCARSALYFRCDMAARFLCARQEAGCTSNRAG